MPCTSPLKGYVARKGGWTSKISEGWADRKLSISCGQCLDCKIERSRQWTIRIMHEAQCHRINSFVTLTYSDDNLPDSSSLEKTEIQKFLKRLRKKIEPHKIRYYLCGEYGDITDRPHYHAILFNYWPDDCKYHSEGSKGHQLFTSKTLDNVWKKGFVTIGKVTFESASYTASYVTKKITGDEKRFHYRGRESEFALMSRNHGIGHEWYRKYQDETWASNSIVQRNKEMAPPTYYKKFLKKENSELYEKLLEESRLKMTKQWFTEWDTHIQESKKTKYRENFSWLKMQHFKKNKI